MEKKTLFFISYFCYNLVLFASNSDLLAVFKNNPARDYFSTLFNSKSQLLNPGSCFTNIYGTSGQNFFNRSIRIGNDYYVTGSDGIHATLSRIDLSGNLIWTNVLNDTSSWADLIESSGNILLVGQRDRDNTSGSPGGRDLLTGLCSPNGNFLSLLVTDYSYQETHIKVVRHPNPSIPGAMFYVLGQVENSGADKPVLTFLSAIGTEMGRIVIDGQDDDEFYQDIAITNTAGDLLISGTRGSVGHFTKLNRHGSIIAGGADLPTNYSISSIWPKSDAGNTFEFIFGGRNANGAILLYYSNNIQFQYQLSGLSTITNIIPFSNTQFYAIGTGSHLGVSKSIILQFNISGGAVTKNWSRFVNDGSNPASVGGRMFIDVGTNLVYTDTRTNALGGFGMQDGLFSVQGLNMLECNKDSVSTTLTRSNFTLSSFLASSNTEPTNNPRSDIASLIVPLSQNIICRPPIVCNVDLHLSQSNCGVLSANCSHNLSGSVNYCWDFGDAPPCGSPAQQTNHTYNNNGAYNV